MRKTALLSLLVAGFGATRTAAAGTHIEDFGNVESITLTGATAVPLYTTPGGGLLPCVQVKIGEELYLFGLDLGYGIYVGERLVGDLGLEPEEEEYKHFTTVKTTEIESMSIGDLVLNGVTAMAQAPEDNDRAPFYESNPSGGTLDGYIGLGVLSQIAWSIQPSTGQVIFAPLSEGPELVNSLKEGGSILTWRDTETVVEKYGKTKIGVLANTFIIPGTIGGAAVDVVPSFIWWNSAVRSDTETPEGPSRHYSDTAHTWLPVQLGGQPAQDSWVEVEGGTAGALELVGRPQFTQDYPDGVIGGRVLTQLDIAADPTGKKIAFRAATEQQRQSPVAFLIEDATADTVKVAEVPEGEEADPDAKPGSAAAWARLANLQAIAGDLTGAIASEQKRLEYDDNDKLCSVHSDIGVRQLAAGDLDAAIESLSTASSLYHAWWDQDLQTRRDIEEVLGEYESDEEKAASEHADVFVQPGSCYTTDRQLAMAWLGQGDTEKVGEIFSERMDLDDGLAVIQGNAALLDGNLSLARAAYYQAAMLEGSPESISRLGQALVHDNAGDWAHAETLYRKALELNPYDVMAAQLWVDASIRAKSAAATTRATEQLLADNPDSAAAYTAHARALRLAGDDGKLKQLSRRGDAFFEQYLRLFPTSGELAASRALFLVETGRLAAGQEAAETALIATPDAVLAWLALGNIYVLSGDIDRGEEMLKRAGRIGAYSPGFAMLVNTDIPEPQPAPAESTPK
jgi:tetratricopeptide (TPR) repeat protein